MTGSYKWIVWFYGTNDAVICDELSEVELPVTPVSYPGDVSYEIGESWLPVYILEARRSGEQWSEDSIASKVTYDFILADVKFPDEMSYLRQLEAVLKCRNKIFTIDGSDNAYLYPDRLHTLNKAVLLANNYSLSISQKAEFGLKELGLKVHKSLPEF